MPPANQPRQREIRVFISSTFRDMQEEREELVKRIFPQLRRLCESRAVTWGEVDLRWGIPDEAKAEGKVLPLCLDEIERCRPYFIGLLGERYGWVPEEIPPELLEAQPWLNQYRKQSVTALEIFHGVLLNPKMAQHAFFYFRDLAYAARAGFTEEDPARRDQLVALKDAIRKSGFPVAENFLTPRQLGEWVLRDLTAVIESRYPESSIPDPLDRAAADHEAYAASRRRVYIGRPEYMERLDAHAAGDGPPLVVLGESGGGKSALLANWTHRWRDQHPETPVIVHFIGASPDSADWMAMLRRLLGEFQRPAAPPRQSRSPFGFLRRMFGRVAASTLKLDIPGQPDALRMAFANALHRVAARGRVVLVLDALNQIEDRDGAPDLAWLPPSIPHNVRLIVSTLPGRPLDDLRKRGWPTLTVQPLQDEERQKLVVDCLGQYGKQLSHQRRGRIASAPQSANGLYLTTLLNELRLFGSHEELDPRIDWYLEAANPFDLFGKVIHRWEADYQETGALSEGLVGRSLSRLWAARRGLSEAELLESLGTDGSPLPHAAWTPLFLAAGDALVNRGGLLSFAHDFLRKAVRERYLPAAGDRRSAHRTLAEYFHRQAQGPRQLDELPWQWQEAAEWQRLADLLARPGFFDALWQKNEYEVKTYWTRIEKESPLRMERIYADVIGQPARDSFHAWLVGCLLDDTGKPEAAMRIREALVELFREQGDRAKLSIALAGPAAILRTRGDLDGATALLKEQERLCRDLGNQDALQASLFNQAAVLRDRGDLDGALAVIKEDERRCRKQGDKYALSASLGGQSAILQERGDLDGALALLREQERLCREIGNQAGLAQSLVGRATILQVRGDLDGAMAVFQEQERLCRELGNQYGLSMSLGYHAKILQDRGDLDGALAVHQEQERLCRELGNKLGLMQSLMGGAEILRARGNLDGAMALLKEQEGLCRELGNNSALAASLGAQADILQERGDLDGALALIQEEVRLCREHGDRAALSAALGDRASILKARGDVDGAMTVFQEQERLCRELGNKDGLQEALGNQAATLRARGDLEGALRLSREQARLSRELGNQDGLQEALGNQAATLHTRGDLDGAMALFKEQEGLCRKLGNKHGLQASLGSQAVILYTRGDANGAMTLFKEQERLCRKLGDKDALQASLGNQGPVLYARGDLDGGMALFKEQERLCREIGNRGGLQSSLGNQAAILKTRGELDGAIAMLKEQERLCRELANKDGLQASLANQALILKSRGDLDGAMALSKEQERLCRELGKIDGLQASFGIQAAILFARRDLEGALSLLKEQERLCRELGNKEALQLALGNQAPIRQSRGDLDGAMALSKEQERLCRELGNPYGLAASLANQASQLRAIQGRRREARRLADEALAIATRHGYGQLIPQIQQVRNSIPSSEE